MKGEQFFKSLKVVADAHHGNIYEVIGNLGFQKAICHTRILSWGNGRHVFDTRREEGINFDTF